MLFSLLLLFLTQSITPTTIFPSDSRPLAQGEDSEIIQTVCPGHAEKEGKVECGKNCPSSSRLDMGMHFLDWSLVRITRGHFLSASSDDAVISTLGCDPHSENWGGSVFLTRRVESWRVIWYTPGVETLRCHRTPLKSGREILVCQGEFGGNGNVWTQLYVEDLLRPKGSLMAGESHGFFEAPDNVASCGFIFGRDANPAPVIRSAIRKVSFGTGADGNTSLSVEFLFGRLSPTSEQLKACIDNQYVSGEPEKAKVLIPRMQRYRMDFVLDADDFKPTQPSAALAKHLGLR